jgi:hypothetical protein
MELLKNLNYLHLQPLSQASIQVSIMGHWGSARCLMLFPFHATWHGGVYLHRYVHVCLYIGAHTSRIWACNKLVRISKNVYTYVNILCRALTTMPTQKYMFSTDVRMCVGLYICVYDANVHVDFVCICTHMYVHIEADNASRNVRFPANVEQNKYAHEHVCRNCMRIHVFP